jgi:hypothetical protein
MRCLHCDTQTENPKFCSRSCATSHNNKANPKRKPEHKCKKCSTPVTARHRYCEGCKPLPLLQKPLSYFTKNGANGKAYPAIRSHSRKAYIDSGRPMECFVCGYSYHVDVCHITAIHEFSGDTLLSEVNALSNLVALCKNHHYEFDNGDLILSAPEEGIEPPLSVHCHI